MLVPSPDTVDTASLPLLVVPPPQPTQASPEEGEASEAPAACALAADRLFAPPADESAPFQEAIDAWALGLGTSGEAVPALLGPAAGDDAGGLLAETSASGLAVAAPSAASAGAADTPTGPVQSGAANSEAVTPLIASLLTGPQDVATPPLTSPSLAPTLAPAAAAALSESLSASVAAAAMTASTPTPQVDAAAFSQALASMPLRIEGNVGQHPSDISYFVHTGDYGASLSPTGYTFLQQDGGRVDVHFAGANAGATAVTDALTSASVSYFVPDHAGQSAEGVQLNVPVYSRVAFQDVYAGVDLAYCSDHGQRGYDFVVATGANPGQIALDVTGARSVSVDASGDLLLETAAGTLREHAPTIYQDVGGARQAVDGGYVVEGSQVHFRIGDYDHAHALVIDPIVGSAYYGNAGADTLNAIKVDPSPIPMWAVMVGTTTGGAGFTNLSVTRWNFGGGPVPLQQYFFGGTGNSGGRAVDINRAGPPGVGAHIVYVAGFTYAQDFPLRGPAPVPMPGTRNGVFIGLDTNPAFYTPPVGWNNGNVRFSYVSGGLGEDDALAVTSEPAGAGGIGGAYFAGISDQRFINGFFNYAVWHYDSTGIFTEGVVGNPNDFGGDTKATGIAAFINPALEQSVIVVGSTLDGSVPGTHPLVLRLDQIRPLPANKAMAQPWWYIDPRFGEGTKAAIDTNVLDPDGVNFSVVVTAKINNTFLNGSDLWLARLSTKNGFFGPAPGFFNTAFRLGSVFIGWDVVINPFAPAPGGDGSSIYVTGVTDFQYFPGLNAFVAKFDLNGALFPSPIPIFVFGGAADDIAYGLDLYFPAPGALPDVLSVGQTNSLNFPVLNWPPFSPVYMGGSSDSFITQLRQPF